MDEGTRLFGDGLADAGVRVTEPGDSESAQRVDVLLARAVKEPRPAPGSESHG